MATTFDAESMQSTAAGMITVPSPHVASGVVPSRLLRASKRACPNALG